MTMMAGIPIRPPNSIAIRQLPTFPWYSLGTIVEAASAVAIRCASAKLPAPAKGLTASPSSTAGGAAAAGVDTSATCGGGAAAAGFSAGGFSTVAWTVGGTVTVFGGGVTAFALMTFLSIASSRAAACGTSTARSRSCCRGCRRS